MKYVILGSSAAGMNAARELRRLDREGEIVLISKDRDVYSRCILHHYLGDTRTKAQLNFVEPDFEQRYRIVWKRGTACQKLDCSNKQLHLSDGTSEGYGKLLIATGSHTFKPPIPGLDKAKNAYGFRSMEDMERIKEEAVKAKHPIVVGAGLVGVDTLSGLMHMGKKCVLVEMADRLLSRQLDKRAASTYEKAFEGEGNVFYFSTGVKELFLNADDRIERIALNNGEELPCDLLVITAGVRANVEFLEGSGVETDRFGLLIDEAGCTNVADVYGAGDVTGRTPIWSAAVKEGLIAAANMTGASRKMTDYFASKSTMNFMRIPTMSLGNCEAPDDSYQIESEDDGTNYKKIIHKDGQIYGAILQGDLSYAGILTQLIAHKIDVSKVEKPLFKVDYSDFFQIDENFEFYYDEVEEGAHE